MFFSVLDNFLRKQSSKLKCTLPASTHQMVLEPGKSAGALIEKKVTSYPAQPLPPRTEHGQPVVQQLSLKDRAKMLKNPPNPNEQKVLVQQGPVQNQDAAPSAFAATFESTK